MKKVMTAAFALSALFAASGKVHAEVNYPWCIIGENRGIDCYFSSRDQCMQDGRNRGFGSQCIQNPAYKSGKPTVSQTARPSQQAVSAAATCTGLKLACLSVTSRKGWCTYLGGNTERGFGRGPYCEKQCNFTWEQCMKSGFWEGAALHRPAERR
jgi:hypothetical protein